MSDFFGRSHLLISFLRTIYMIESVNYWHPNLYSQNLIHHVTFKMEFLK